MQDTSHTTASYPHQTRMVQDLDGYHDCLVSEASRDTNLSISGNAEPGAAVQEDVLEQRPTIPDFVEYCINRKSLDPRQNIILENAYCLARVQSRCFVYTMESLIYRMVKNARQQRYQDIIHLKKLIKMRAHRLVDDQQFEEEVISLCAGVQL